MARCSATAKTTGERCRGQAVTGMDVCRMHGGRSLAGADSPAFRHGRYSKRLPDHLLALYEEARADPDLLNLSDELALLDGRLADVFGRIGDFDPVELKGRLSILSTKLRDAIRRAEEGDEDAIPELGDIVAKMIAAADEAVAEWKVWQETKDLVERRRKLVETETKRRMAGQQVITAAEAMVMLTFMRQAVDDEVSDPAVRLRIARRLGALMDGGPR